LGRPRERPRPPRPYPARPAAHRGDLDGRRRNPSPRAPGHPRPPVHRNHQGLPALRPPPPRRSSPTGQPVPLHTITEKGATTPRRTPPVTSYTSPLRPLHGGWSTRLPADWSTSQALFGPLQHSAHHIERSGRGTARPSQGRPAGAPETDPRHDEALVRNILSPGLLRRAPAKLLPTSAESRGTGRAPGHCARLDAGSG